MSLEQFNIIESTLREGEQFVNAFFTLDQKIEIARLLDAFGVEYLELTTPCASPQSEIDCRAIASLGLRARTLTHTRCAMEDVRRAVGTGVSGVDVVIGTSSYLREFSHGKSIAEIIGMAQEVVGWLKTQSVEVRFSTEDSLRSEPEDLYRVYAAVDQMGVDRVGIADTVGIGNPRQIYELVSGLHRRVRAGIEFHGHNDTGCAIANAFAALEAGASYIDTSVLGIGERNGITALGGLIARLYAVSPALVGKYNLPLLLELDRLVAGLVRVDIPFNNYVTGFSAFTHKAGIHAKAVLNNPSTYEVLRPEDFGLTRYIHIAHRLTGWNAVRYRAGQLGLELSDAQVRAVTDQIKRLSDERELALDEVDGLLMAAIQSVQSREEISA
ncbi:homocitrate synthase [Longilinea arvoryzae]|uniref:Homocitrate synthase n=1 Tax=Longilinea arvoryzae TaxID=360412 RepID=A0A0S7B7H9_9CHLR|nr:homocitrate synthase [Longilinea arvoryzae]GAP13159.1 homocitrate synthase [Longilinea arvoryzae]